MENKGKHIKLHDIPKRHLHQVPEHYFEQLPTRIMARTAAAGVPQAAWWQQGLWRPLRVAVAPLLLLLVFACVYFLNMPARSAAPPIRFAALAEVEIVDYLTDTNTPLETADLAELTSLSDQDLTADFLNVSSKAAAEELEYHPIEDQDF
ncbi:hypothetical protein [Pontibacter liquoris]|uniref:hypothetical protein n=1 Tax=Pontibacter liquoris TaxID=2905677 RepID=UPI001FA76ABE|nr:hypothetical protein [Pontibacter liquoris]